MLLGLAYLARREIGHGDAAIEEGNIIDFSDKSLPQMKAQLVSFQSCHGELCYYLLAQPVFVQAELQDIQRAMQMCMVTRYRKTENQLAALSALNIPHSAVLLHQGRSALLKPLFLIIRDDARETLTVLIRGTTSIRDVFTSLTGARSYQAYVAPPNTENPTPQVQLESEFPTTSTSRYLHRR